MFKINFPLLLVDAIRKKTLFPVNILLAFKNLNKLARIKREPLAQCTPRLTSSRGADSLGK